LIQRDFYVSITLYENQNENLFLPDVVASAVLAFVEGVVTGVVIVTAMPLVVHYQQS
jgi:hypothetical protein